MVFSDKLFGSNIANKPKVKLSLIVAISWAATTARSQCVNSSSAEVSSEGIVMSHIVGQTLSAESRDGSVSSGQIPQYGVTVLTGEELTHATLSYVYPNPTGDVLQLHVGEANDLSYAVVDMRGVVLASYQIDQQDVMVDFSRFTPGTYSLVLYRGTEGIKTFGIIKR